LTKEERLKATQDTENMTHEEIALYCRERGIYQHNLNEWKKEIYQVYLSGSDKGKIKQLKRELTLCKKEMEKKDKTRLLLDPQVMLRPL
jgi:hypothetical protein